MKQGFLLELLYSTAGVRELDRIAIEEKGLPGLTLMKRAGEACVDVLLDTWNDPGQVSVFCGSGNNAGDGYIIAGLLKSKGVSVNAVLVGREPEPGTDAGAALDFMHQNNVAMVSADEALGDATVIVDALLGTGTRGPVRENYAKVIQAINASTADVLAVDLPSGLNADTGATGGTCIRARCTVTFIGRKLGLYTADGPEFTGEIHFADLDVPHEIFGQVDALADALDYGELVNQIPGRHRNAHKLDHGHVLVVGGDLGMPGAVCMAAEAALMVGAGMVTVATRAENVAAIVSARPEVMARGVSGAADLVPLVAKANTLVLGPGLGTSDWSRELIVAAREFDGVSVVDADGLNLLAENPAKNDLRVLTPHPGEARRLLDGESIQNRRPEAVQQLRDRYGGTIVLKGAGTLIIDEGGMSLCPYGNPGMSVAGMGDVLAGTIGGLLAQGLAPGLAARLGASVHSLAADILTDIQGERGLLATELLPEIRALLNP